MQTQIPDGYKQICNFSPTKVMGSVLAWNDFIGEGVIFWHYDVLKKMFYIPFVLEQVKVPSFKTHDLFTLIHKGLGAEFVPLIKKELTIHQLPKQLKNNDLLPFNLKILIPTTQNVNDIVIQVKQPIGFLLRREDLIND